MKKFLLCLGMALMLLLAIGGSTEEVEAAKSTAYTKKGQVLTVKVKKGADITDNLDDTLKAARDLATKKKPITVVVPEGTYKISDVLHIYSNTTLDVRGVTLKYSGKGSHTMLMSGTNGKYKNQNDYNRSKKCAGYNGFENITVKGGTWISTTKNTSTIIRFAHAKNVTLDGVTLSGGGCAHQIEVAAINGFYVKNCTFKNFGDENDEEKQEALQLDIACAESGFRGVYLDGTPMKNVEITGCTFSNVPRGVGSHTLLVGAYFDNVKINNNTFTKVWEEAIVALNYVNCEIKDNTIKNCGAGILVQYFKATSESIYTTVFDGKKAYKGKEIHDANTIISGNTITTKYNAAGNGVIADEIQGIKVYGLDVTKKMKGGDKKVIPKKNYYISGVTIEDNTITTAGFGIHIMDAKDTVIRNNKITQKNVSKKDENKNGYDGIFIEKDSNITEVTSNTIKSMKADGIYVQVDAVVNNITKNKISNVGRHGISLFDNSSVENIVKNTITNATDNAIMLSTGCEVSNIKDNTISLKKCKAGINVYKSKAGNIENNKITVTASSPLTFGMKITDSSTVKNIVNNKMTAKNNVTFAGTGILVDNKSKVSSSIKGNIIGKIKGIAIKVVNTSTVKDIDSNIMTTTDKDDVANVAVLVESKSKVTGAIKNNQIGKVGATVLKINKNATVNAITGNTIQAQNGGEVASTIILINDGAKVSDSISKNTFGNVSTVAIKLSESTVGGSISENTFFDASTAVLIYKSDVIEGIQKNTFGAVKETVIKVADGSTTGSITENKMIADDNGAVATTAILIDGKSKVDGSISSNEIGKISGNAMKIASSQVTGSIKDNTFSDIGSNAILVYGSKVGGDISGNTIESTNVGIAVKASSTVTGAIKNNEVKQATDRDILVDKSSKVGSIE